MRRVLLAAACTVLLTGCDSSGDGEPAASGADFDGVDVCALLPADEVAGYLGGERPAPAADSTLSGPRCVWKLDEFQKVELMLWRPPLPDVLTDNPERTMDVGGRPAYVGSQTATACLMDIDAGGAAGDRWLHLDVSSPAEPDADLTADGATCDRLAGTARGVLDKLGW